MHYFGILNNSSQLPQHTYHDIISARLRNLETNADILNLYLEAESASNLCKGFVFSLLKLH